MVMAVSVGGVAQVLMASMLSIQRWPIYFLRDSLLLTVVAANDAIVATSSSSLSSTSYEQDDMSGEVSSTATFVNIPLSTQPGLWWPVNI